MPPAAALTDATVIRIGQIVGAAQVVIGTLQLEDDALVVRARSIALDTGRVVADVTDRGPLPELFATFERIARRIAPPSTKSSEEIERQHPPMAAFEDFIKGLLAETPATAITYLNSALKRQPTFDRARLALWDVYDAQGDHDRALAAVKPVPAQSPWANRARFIAGLSLLNLKKYDEAFATFKALADAQPTPTVLNNLGVVQLRRGATPRRVSRHIFSTRRPRPIRLTPTISSTWATRTGRIVTRRRRSTGCAKRSGATRPTATRTSCSARRCRRRRQRRRSESRERAGSPPLIDVRRVGETPRT